MEDEHTIIRNFDAVIHHLQNGHSPGSNGQPFGYRSFCGVYDGHSGTEAAQFCRDRLHLNVAQQLLLNSDICEAMKLGCMQTDREFLELSKTEKFESGAVVCLTVLDGKQLYIANAGDCRAVLCRAGKAISLTKDHKPTLYEERVRVESEGGYVEYEALNGLLDVSRALGDRDPDTGEKMKGLTAEPETFKIYLTDDDEFVIVACDGLWDVCESSAAVTWARRSLQENDNDVQKASNDLVHHALIHGSSDNVTAVIIAFTKIAADGTQYVIPSAAQEKQWKHQTFESTDRRRRKLGPRAIQSILEELKTPHHPTPQSERSSSISLSRSTSSFSYSSRSSSSEDLWRMSPLSDSPSTSPLRSISRTSNKEKYES